MFDKATSLLLKQGLKPVRKKLHWFSSNAKNHASRKFSEHLSSGCPTCKQIGPLVSQDLINLLVIRDSQTNKLPALRAVKH